MASANINGFTVGYTVAGAIVLWSGIKGSSISGAVRSALSGKTSLTETEQITGSSGSDSASVGSGSAGSKSASYSGAGVQKLWVSNGGSQSTAAIAEAIANAESGGSATVTSSNPDGGTNVGIFQLDTNGVGSGYSVSQLQNPDLNTRITVMATNNGRNWTEWGDPVADALPNHQYTPGSPVP